MVKDNNNQNKNKKENEIPAETRALNPVNGQVLNDIDEALNAVVDLKGQKIDFKRNEDIKNDIVYTGEGSDGKTYTVQLEKKTVIVSVFGTPKPEEEGKIKSKKPSEGTKPKSKDKKKDEYDLDKVVDQLDKPILEKEEAKK